jgi:TPR repeat protein
VKFSTQGSGDPLDAPDSKAAKTVADLKTKTVAGDPRSQLSYGIVISMRHEFDDGQTKPMQWFVAAAQAGVPAAQYLLGLHLMQRSGVEEDETKAVFWLEQAARNGAGAAATALASYLLRKDADSATRQQGFDWMKRASESTHREGKLLFAALLVSWPEASRRDPVRALALIEEGALDNDPLIPEIRAAALAAQGDFEGAQRAQQAAIRIGRRLHWDVGPQQARLAAYAKGQLADGELVVF